MIQVRCWGHDWSRAPMGPGPGTKNGSGSLFSSIPHLFLLSFSSPHKYLLNSLHTYFIPDLKENLYNLFYNQMDHQNILLNKDHFPNSVVIFYLLDTHTWTFLAIFRECHGNIKLLYVAETECITWSRQFPIIVPFSEISQNQISYLVGFCRTYDF